MRNRFKNFYSITIYILAYLALSTNKAFAAFINYNFSQNGWTGGGVVTGSFSGNTDAQNQMIVSPAGLTSFSFKWSGNSYIAPYSVDNSYSLGTFQFDAENPTTFSIYLYSGEQIEFFYNGNSLGYACCGNTTNSSNPVIFTENTSDPRTVSEPRTLLGASVALGFGFLLRRELW
jgi:hypothetical protein